MPDALESLALDLTWTWDPRVRQAFEHLDPVLWRESGHNPVVMVRRMFPDARAAAARRPEIAEVLVRRNFGFPGGQAWGAGLGDGVAYFSMEFALTDHLPIYSGGLGVLAGDHLKAAAQMGLPITGVGLLYRTGFARQRVSWEGDQISEFPVNDRDTMPIEPVTRAGKQLEIEFPVGARRGRAALWRCHVGPASLLLLDTDLAANPEPIRAATDRLYTAEPEQRLLQEIVLGVGGVRALRAAGLNPLLFHLNEGHSFLALTELTRELVAGGVPLDEAREQVRRRSIFTTHTPVAAGSDYFPLDMVDKLLGPLIKDAGLTAGEFIDNGRKHPGDGDEALCTTYFALRGAGKSVAVSKLHAEVSRAIWKDAWPHAAEDDVPIGHVTNGVHMPTWVADSNAALLREFVAENWWDLDPDDSRWRDVALIPDQRLWDIRRGLRRRLVTQVNQRNGHTGFNPDVLTIGFARRFAAYKRASLMLADVDRLRAILGNPEREVQIVIAGKAHPNDGIAQDILRQIVHFARDEPRVAFLEDYDLTTAALLVQGADVWLNNPRRLLEASGTSGMKAGANGSINLSVNDGWWDEGRRSDAGWTIFSDNEIDAPELDDRLDAEALYRTLEERVVPLFYDRDPSGLPSGWIAMMRSSIQHIASAFSARRMVLDYYRECYLPAARLAVAPPSSPRLRGEVGRGASQSTPKGGRLSTAE